MKTGALAIILIAIVAVLSPTAVSADMMYIVDLQMDATWSEATAINDTGQVVCTASTCVRPFVWQDGMVIPISEPVLSLPPVSPIPFPITPGDGVIAIRGRDFAINGSGQVVGATRFGLCPHVITMDATTSPDGSSADTEGPEGAVGVIYLESAFLWDNGVSSLLDGIPSPSAATGINCYGQIAGTYQNDRRSPSRGFTWHEGDITEIEMEPSCADGSVYPRSINDAGQVVGTADFVIPDYRGWMVPRAFLWQQGSMIDLGSLEAPGFWPEPSSASDVNNSCQVVGSSGAESFIWEAGVMTPLWHNGEWIRDGEWMIIENGRGAVAINDLGQVVGSKFTADDGFRAMIWQGGLASDLNTLVPAGSGWVLREALDINNTGQIVGWGEYNGNDHRAFLLVNPDVTASIDLMPGNMNNQINLKSSKKVSVAVLSTPEFDARDVNPDTLILAGTKSSGYSVRDVNHDDYPDILCDFSVPDMNLAPVLTQLTLYGRCHNGRTVIGVDAVTIK